MPNYDYVCSSCKREFEFFQSIKDDPLTDCGRCGTPTLKRKIGGGAGIIFKGSGFYETDYRRTASKKEGGEKAEKKTSAAGD